MAKLNLKILYILKQGLKTGFRLIIYRFKIKTFGLKIIKCSQKPEQNSIEMVKTFLKLEITPTPWLTLLLVLGKTRVKQNLC